MLILAKTKNLFSQIVSFGSLFLFLGVFVWAKPSAGFEVSESKTNISPVIYFRALSSPVVVGDLMSVKVWAQDTNKDWLKMSAKFLPLGVRLRNCRTGAGYVSCLLKGRPMVVGEYPIEITATDGVNTVSEIYDLSVIEQL